MLSIICAYNNKQILKESLEKSLKTQQDIRYEYIPINAEEYGFRSAAETLNYAGKMAKGEVLVFVHQDVIFEKDNTLAEIYNYCRNYEFGIAGVAGCIEKNGQVIIKSNIYHGENHRKVSSVELKNPENVMSLDECLLIIPKKIFESDKFTYYGNTWHLYATDYCIKMMENKYNVIVFPTEIWHLSDGNSLDNNYFDTIIKIAKKFKTNDKIVTIFGVWPTNLMILTLKCLYRKIRLTIKGK